MSRIIVETWDPDTQAGTQLVRDSETGLPLIVRRQRYWPIVAANRRMASHFDRHHARKANVKTGGGVMVASIPVQEWSKLVRLGIAFDQKAMRKWLNRRDSRLFRVDDGRRL